mmetsp:Transcript_13441/g.31600  ORF Transcript_13441/g.31600 Transcript_13441/m.31600 type:complete len:176 (-) Transcript_13441:257-784(-)
MAASTPRSQRPLLLSALLSAAVLALVSSVRSLAFASASSSHHSTLRSSVAGSQSVTAGLLRGAGRGTAKVVMADGPDQAQMATGAAIFAGLGVGIFIGQVANIISQDNENLSESLQATLSADAGMEDVEDTAGDNAKQDEMVEAMARAQGLSEEEINKIRKQREKTVATKEDDGW